MLYEGIVLLQAQLFELDHVAEVAAIQQSGLEQPLLYEQVVPDSLPEEADPTVLPTREINRALRWAARR